MSGAFKLSGDFIGPARNAQFQIEEFVDRET